MRHDRDSGHINYKSRPEVENTSGGRDGEFGDTTLCSVSIDNPRMQENFDPTFYQHLRKK